VSATTSPGQGASKLVCAQIALDAALSRQMVHLLPPVVTVRLDPPAQAAWRQVCAWLGRGLNLDAEPGTHGVLAKAAELLLIEVVRRHFTAAGDSLAASARGLQDRAVGSCLAAIHERPADPWTVERLARRAHTSRSVLAERFKQLVGTSPMNYLTQCRMTRAARLLRDSTLPLARIAEEVGYETDTAFSRAFRREFGLPPAAWRRAQAATK
jgi:AraC-like DNA-binding protein